MGQELRHASAPAASLKGGVEQGKWSRVLLGSFLRKRGSRDVGVEGRTEVSSELTSRKGRGGGWEREGGLRLRRREGGGGEGVEVEELDLSGCK